MSSLHWADYLILGVSMLLAVIIGMAAAWKRRKNTSMEDYFLGSRSMNPWAIGLSIFASMTSSGALLIMPVEIYLFGSIFAFSGVGQMITAAIVGIFYLPIFYRIKLTSAYKYMELRFQSRFLRLLSSTLFVVQSILHCGLLLYIPVIALNLITDLDVYICILITGFTCLLYTVAGGMRAVVWVDTIQTVVLYGGLITFLIIGSTRVGSNTIMQRANEGGRLNFGITDVDPRVRYTLWSMTIGHALNSLPGSCANQVVLQRYFSVGDLSKARRAFVVGQLLFIPLYMLPVAVGLTMYAFYFYCDPLVTGRVTRPEQLVPKYMIDIAGDIPGVCGVFMASVFASCLSSLSSYINSLAAVCIDDFLKPLFFFLKRRKLPENNERKWSIAFSFLFALLAMGAAFLPNVMGTLIIQLSRVFTVSLLGPILTAFTLGMFVPWANIWGAYVGMFSSMALALWMSIGSVMHGKTSAPLPLMFSDCSFPWPPANFTPPIPEDDVPLQALYDISFQWLGPYSFIFGMMMGMLVSFLSSGCRLRRENVDPDLVYNYSCSSSHSVSFTPGTSDTKEKVDIYQMNSQDASGYDKEGVSNGGFIEKAE